MKVRLRMVSYVLLAALLSGGALTSCAKMSDSFTAPGLQLAAPARALVRPKSADAIPAPDTYWIYGDNFNQMVQASDLIVYGRVISSSAQTLLLSISTESTHELLNKMATIFDVQPIQTIKGRAEGPIIRIAVYPDIPASTLDINTRMQYDGDQEMLAISDEPAIFLLRNCGGDIYFPINILQGFIPVSDDKLFPQESNLAISSGCALNDFVDSVDSVMHFQDEPTAAHYRPFYIGEN